MTLLTIQEAADRLRVSQRTLRREIADGRLAFVKLRSRVLIEPSELDRYIRVVPQRAAMAKKRPDLPKMGSIWGRVIPAPA